MKLLYASEMRYDEKEDTFFLREHLAELIHGVRRPARDMDQALVVRRPAEDADDLVHPLLEGGDAEQMKGDLREVTEIRVNGKAGTFRSMYTARLGSKIYVLHAFQKKSTQGIATPKRDLDLIRKRLQIARKMAKAENP